MYEYVPRRGTWHLWHSPWNIPHSPCNHVVDFFGGSKERAIAEIRSIVDIPGPRLYKIATLYPDRMRACIDTMAESENLFDSKYARFFFSVFVRTQKELDNAISHIYGMPVYNRSLEICPQEPLSVENTAVYKQLLEQHAGTSTGDCLSYTELFEKVQAGIPREKPKGISQVFVNDGGLPLDVLSTCQLVQTINRVHARVYVQSLGNKCWFSSTVVCKTVDQRTRLFRPGVFYDLSRNRNWPMEAVVRRLRDVRRDIYG